MEIKAILFDLDGTLLPMDQDLFVKTYFKALAARLALRGYEPKQLIESIWAGTIAMVKNDGSCMNDEAFWKKFKEIHGEESIKDKPYIDEFYVEEFNQVQTVCGFTPESRAVIDELKKTDKMLVLATNPIFPPLATENRMRWAGLSPEDFKLYTTYENSHYCKPNPKYYLEILEKIGCRPEECIMIGNDVSDDMVTEKLGMKVFLLTDCLINKEDKDISVYPNGSFNELREFLRQSMKNGILQKKNL